MPDTTYCPRNRFITDHDSSNFYPAGICTIPTICYPRVQEKLFLYTREFHTMVAIKTFLMHVSYLYCIFFPGKQLILTTTSMCKLICIPVFLVYVKSCLWLFWPLLPGFQSKVRICWFVLTFLYFLYHNNLFPLK